jgi:hypothetical protein
MQTIRQSSWNGECSLCALPASPGSVESSLGDLCIAIVYNIATSDAPMGDPEDACIAIVYSVKVLVTVPTHSLKVRYG